MISLVLLGDIIRNYLDDMMLVAVPGPDDPDTSGRFVKLTHEPGLGLSTEDLMDQIAVQVEVAGAQNNYQDAEDLARAVDQCMIRQTRQKVGEILVYAWTRGSGPTQSSWDDAKRWRFTCSYTLFIQSALTV